MGFLERLREEKALAQMRRIQEQNLDGQDRDRLKGQKEATKKTAEKGQEKVRLAEAFLQESGVLNLLGEAKKTLRSKGYSHTALQVYTGRDGESGDYYPLLSKGDVVVHLRWGKVGKLNWQRDWPAHEMEKYRGISVSVSSDGEIHVPLNEYVNERDFGRGRSLSLQEWRTDKDLLGDVLWRAYKSPFVLNYGDVESRKRQRRKPPLSSSRSDGDGGAIHGQS